jgi:glycosyltransferase involved in cell wall biosynthesis
VQPGTVSVVIAAFNEAGAIGEVVRQARSRTPGLLEVLVVDDGSGDATADEARQAGATVLSHPRNLGKGQALRTGIGAARGGILVFVDGDGQDDPAEIPLLLEALVPGVDLVIGSRFLGHLGQGAITPVNRAGNRALTWLFNRLFGCRLTDTQAGFRALRRSAVDPSRLRARAYEIETDMTLHVLLAGGRVVEIPVSRFARRAGTTAFHRPYHGMRILATMLRAAVQTRGAPAGRGVG